MVTAYRAALGALPRATPTEPSKSVHNETPAHPGTAPSKVMALFRYGHTPCISSHGS